MYKFLFYKLYRFAKVQEQTVPPNFGFVALVTMFEILHFAILFGFIDEFFGYKFSFVSSLEKYAGVIYLILGLGINYLIFIKTKWIYRINEEYQKQNRILWKDNLLFFLYIFLLAGFFVFLTWYHQKYNI